MTARRRWAWRIGILVALAAALAPVAVGPSQDIISSVTGSANADGSASCLPGEPVPVMDSPVISRSRASSVVYNSVPPTSGPHFSYTVAPGIYDGPVPNALLVSAMAYGNIVIHYAPDSSAEQIGDLESLSRRFVGDVVLAPAPELSSGFVLTAWGRIERLNSVDNRRIATFVLAMRGRYDHGWTRSADCPE